MRRFSALAALTFMGLSASAVAVPTTMTYAGFLTDSGAPVDGPVDLVVELYDARTGGVLLFTEAFQSFVVPDGDLVVELGLATPLDDALLARPELWLQATVDGNAMSPRARLSSVPYALHAGEAATLEGLTAADIQAQVDALQTQITALQAQATSLQSSLTALASAGGPAVAFANVTGLAFQSPLSFSGGNVTVATGGITATHLGTASVGADEIASDAVAAAEIATDAVGAAEIAAGAVTASELATDAVTSGDVLNGTLDTVDIASSSLQPVYKRPLGCTASTQVFSLIDPGTCTQDSCGVCFGGPPCRVQCSTGLCSPGVAATCPYEQVYTLRP